VRSGPDYGVDDIDEIESRALVDTQARKYLGMSGEDFIAQYAGGAIADPDRSDVIRMAMVLPFIKQSKNGREESS